MSQPALQMLEPKEQVGLVVVITGYGKGKTTSALGIVLRSVGHGLRVCIVQFMKGDMFAGEIQALSCSPAGGASPHRQRILRNSRKPLPLQRTPCKRTGRNCSGQEKMLSGQFDVLVCDEINNSLKLKLVDLDQVLDLIDNKPPAMHLVLTAETLILK